jgi:hypothetical protein
MQKASGRDHCTRVRALIRCQGIHLQGVGVATHNGAAPLSRKTSRAALMKTMFKCPAAITKYIRIDRVDSQQGESKKQETRATELHTAIVAGLIIGGNKQIYGGCTIPPGRKSQHTQHRKGTASECNSNISLREDATIFAPCFGCIL